MDLESLGPFVPVQAVYFLIEAFEARFVYAKGPTQNLQFLKTEIHFGELI